MAIVLPSETRQRNNLKAFIADTGLYIYDQAPADAQDPPTPLWWSPIDWSRARRPGTGMMAGAGIHIPTEAGTVSITPLGGCGCSHRALRDWFPTWAQRVEAWPAPSAQNARV